MKIRNKKTGEIADLEYRGFLKSDNNNHIIVYPEGTLKYYAYKSLAELNEEWEDYEEPKEYWFIDAFGNIIQNKITKHRGDAYIDMSSGYEMQKSIGNYFDTPEEAEKAVEKLKAWKRLKDKGFRFDHIRSIDGVSIKYKDLDQYTIIAYADEDGCDQECLDLLFGGEE